MLVNVDGAGFTADRMHAFVGYPDDYAVGGHLMVRGAIPRFSSERDRVALARDPPGRVRRGRFHARRPWLRTRLRCPPPARRRLRHPAPTADPRANLATGPVVNYRIKVRSIAPCRDAGRPLVQHVPPQGPGRGRRVDRLPRRLPGARRQPGERVRARNASGSTTRCIGYRIPQASSTGSAAATRSSSARRSSDAGDVTVQATLDGVQSNVLVIRAMRGGCPAPEELAGGARARR